jgi:flagellar basal body-associated protein FliL
MAVCSNCGKELGDETTFCESCGTKLGENAGKTLYKNAASAENRQRESVAGKSLVVAVWLIVVLLIVGLATAWSLTTENKNKAMAKPDKHISLSEKWTNDECSIKLEGTYIYGAETFCYKITTTEKTRQVSSVSLSSTDNDAISVILVDDLKDVGYNLSVGNGRGYSNCTKMDSVMFHRVMNDMAITSSKKSSW